MNNQSYRENMEDRNTAATAQQCKFKKNPVTNHLNQAHNEIFKGKDK